MSKNYDAVIIGAGHNGLVAAAYLSKAGKKVLVIEASPEIGGATASVKAFPEHDAKISRYSYLISLFPDKIIQDLGLGFETISRSVSSYTPYVRNGIHKGLCISRQWDHATEDSFVQLTGSPREARAWRNFYGKMEAMAKKIAPTLLEPLPSRTELRNLVGMDDAWRMVFERPIGEAILQHFESDIVRGIVLTDGLIGTHASAFDLQASKCFLYHLIGNGTGEWKIPKGGMGALVTALQRAALGAGAEIRTSAKAVGLHTSTDKVEVHLEDGTSVTGKYLLCNAAPNVLASLYGKTPATPPDGAQIKINMLLERLPRFRSGIDSKTGFAGTLHLQESFPELEKAYHDSKAGNMPDTIPIEMYCHTLTDVSILSRELQYRGCHTLTLFGLHTPASLFDKDPEGARQLAAERALAGLDAYLEEPIRSCMTQNADGSLCMEIKSPLDIEAEISLPRGNIFHKNLTFPFIEESGIPGWGVETEDPRVLICGSGAVRGGGVSGIPGHNAAMAILKGN